jgi:hypothetical protein
MKSMGRVKRLMYLGNKEYAQKFKYINPTGIDVKIKAPPIHPDFLLNNL